MTTIKADITLWVSDISLFYENGLHWRADLIGHYFKAQFCEERYRNEESDYKHSVACRQHTHFLEHHGVP